MRVRISKVLLLCVAATAMTSCSAEQVSGFWGGVKKEAKEEVPKLVHDALKNPTPVGVAGASLDFIYKLILAGIAGAGTAAAAHKGGKVVAKRRAARSALNATAIAEAVKTALKKE